MKTWRSLFLVLLVLLLVQGQGLAADAKDKLQKVESALSEQKKQAALLDQKAEETNASLKELRQKLIVATETLQAKSAEEALIEDKIEDLEADISKREAVLVEEKGRLRAIVSALLALARQPMATLFLQSGITNEHIERAIVLRDVVPRLLASARAIAENILALHEAEKQMQAQGDLVVAARKNLEEQQKNLDQMIKVRQGYLQKTAAQKAALARQLASLTSEAHDLRQLLEKVSPKKRARPAPPAAGTVQGKVRWPVDGKIVRRFGDKDADGVVTEGIAFAALPGSPVVAPYGGKVVFAGPFRGYGQIVIVQHEGGYHSFLAGFGRIDADMGQDVDVGEPLGVLPTGVKRPELYFEWRKNSEPIDPGRGITLSKSQ